MCDEGATVEWDDGIEERRGGEAGCESAEDDEVERSGEGVDGVEVELSSWRGEPDVMGGGMLKARGLTGAVVVAGIPAAEDLCLPIDDPDDEGEEEGGDVAEVDGILEGGRYLPVLLPRDPERGGATIAEGGVLGTLSHLTTLPFSSTSPSLSMLPSSPEHINISIEIKE